MLRLGETIRALRKRRGFTQSQLAGKELTKSYISQIEHGRIVPSMRALDLLASRLGCSTADLVGRTTPNDALDDAEAVFLEGDVSSAWERLERISATGDLSPRYLVLAADVGSRLRKGQTPELVSLALAEETLSNTERARALNAWGIYLAAEGDSEGALERFEKARESLDSGSSDIPLRLRVLSNCGNFQARLGRMREALTRLHEYLDLSRRSGIHLVDGAVYVTLGIVYRRLGESTQAEDALRRALFHYRSDGDALMEGACLHNLGIVYRQENDLQEAERFFRNALGFFPLGGAERSNSLFELAQVLVRQESPTEAYKSLEEVDPLQLGLADRPKYPIVLAQCYRLLGHPEKAVETLRKDSEILDSATQDLQAEAAKEQAFALMELGRIREAQQAISKSMQLVHHSTGAGLS